MKILRKNEKEMLKIKNTVKAMKNGLISRLDSIEGRLSELEDVTIETSKLKIKEKKKRMKKQIQDLWGSYKRINIGPTGIPEEDVREKGRKPYICEAIMAENFPKLMSDAKAQTKETQRIPPR